MAEIFFTAECVFPITLFRIGNTLLPTNRNIYGRPQWLPWKVVIYIESRDNLKKSIKSSIDNFISYTVQNDTGTTWVEVFFFFVKTLPKATI